MPEPDQVHRHQGAKSPVKETDGTGTEFVEVHTQFVVPARHRSPEAAAIVRDFLDRAPRSYPDCLRRIILASADRLFRASR